MSRFERHLPSPSMAIAIVALMAAVKPSYESEESCTPDLCIEPAPAPGGSAGTGGWGLNSATRKPITDLAVNSATRKPITDLAVGTTNGLTVTVLQPNIARTDGTITLTYDPYDFSYLSNGDTTAACTQASYPAVSCTYTDLGSSSAGDTFQFKALHADPYAVVTATADVVGAQATATFPVSITG